jgi:hypothetical protein
MLFKVLNVYLSVEFRMDVLGTIRSDYQYDQYLDKVNLRQLSFQYPRNNHTSFEAMKFISTVSAFM